MSSWFCKQNGGLNIHLQTTITLCLLDCKTVELKCLLLNHLHNNNVGSYDALYLPNVGAFSEVHL